MEGDVTHHPPMAASGRAQGAAEGWQTYNEVPSGVSYLPAGPQVSGWATNMRNSQLRCVRALGSGPAVPCRVRHTSSSWRAPAAAEPQGKGLLGWGWQSSLGLQSLG